MSQLDETLAALLDLARRDDAAGILPVNEVVDRFTVRVGGSLDRKLLALNRLRDAFERRSPNTELARYALAVIDNRRHTLGLDWWDVYRRTGAPPSDGSDGGP
jgi:hypothetical protein